jgi:hypothetical protein
LLIIGNITGTELAEWYRPACRTPLTDNNIRPSRQYIFSWVAERQSGGATVFIAVSLLVLWYTAHALLSRFVGTCTMGDTDRFVTGIIFGMPAAVIAVALLLLAGANTGWRMGVELAIVPLALVIISLWVPLAISAGIRGHHLCGPEFDEYLITTSAWKRVIPVVHVAAATALLVSAFLNVCRAVWPKNRP